ncbi:MAG: hypothetical protein ACR2Q4_03330, partial [Geminicoccaceae bacterium]
EDVVGKAWNVAHVNAAGDQPRVPPDDARGAVAKAVSCQEKGNARAKVVPSTTASELSIMPKVKPAPVVSMTRGSAGSQQAP